MIAELVGKEIEVVGDLEKIAQQEGYTRTRVWDERNPMVGDCQMDMKRINVHVDVNGKIVKVVPG